MLSEKLKENTKVVHIELERILVHKIKSIRTIDDYLEILGGVYRFFAPLEKAIFFQLDKTLPDAVSRRKSEWIVEDIHYFDPSYSSVTPYASTPVIQKPSHAVGALYVMEGSTLGGQMICKMISQKLNLLTSRGLKFFSGYEDNTHVMWGNFKKFLNSGNWSQEEEKEAVDTANRTFILFKQSID
jgi:heme oxygenase